MSKSIKHTESSIYRRIINLQNQERTLSGIQRINRDLLKVESVGNSNLYDKVKAKFVAVEQTMKDQNLSRVKFEIGKSMQKLIKNELKELKNKRKMKVNKTKLEFNKRTTSKTQSTLGEAKEIPVMKIEETRINDDQILTADQILNTNFETLPFNGKWEELMQSPASNLTAIVYGKPKNGKTSFSFQFADYLNVFGSVLYVLADQGVGQATKKLITDMRVHGNNNLYFMATRDLNELDEKISKGNFKFIFLDLINNFQISAQQMEDFIHKHRDKGFILVMESTKSGDFRGEQKWTHIVDSIIKIENFVADNSGRYGSGSYTWPNPNR